MIGDRASALLELLVRINREVAGALDLRTVLQRLSFAAMQHVGGERASIVVVDDMGRPVDAIIVYGSNLHEHTTRQLRETLDRGLAGWVVRNRKPALVPDTSLDERWVRRPDDAVDKSGAKSAICVPLEARGRLVGALTIVHSLPKAFGDDHLELAQAIADQASIAVLNARLYNESTRQARIMSALAEGAAAFGSSLDLKVVWERILSQTIQALQVETAALGLLDSPEGALVFRAALGKDRDRIEGRSVAAGLGVVGEVLGKGRAILIANAAEDPRYVPAQNFPGIEVRALLAAPIQSQGKLIGVLEVLNPTAKHFDPDAMTVILGMGGLAGATIHNAQLYEQLGKARQHYEELFEESTDLIFVTDRDGKIREANRRASQATGYRTEQLRGMDLGQLHGQAAGAAGKSLRSLRDSGSAHYESALRTVDNRSVPVEVHARPIGFPTADSVLWTLHDLTERKELEELRQNLTSMIYHDLRSPLSNLVSSLDLLRGMIADEADARMTLEIAERSTERMNRLVSSLLDINRLESGSTLTNQSPILPEELVRTAIRDVSPMAEARQHTIRKVTAPGLPEIWVDGDMMRRVLINLLENAMKFSRAGRDVEIGARREGDNMIFWVRDEGPGIPTSEHQRIFVKFARPTPGTEREAGLGLGLTFCQMAVRSHQGTIRVESEPGKGSTFIISLPVNPGVTV